MIRSAIYLSAILVLVAGFSVDHRTVEAQGGGSWESCYMTWFGYFIGPPECGSPPPGSECYPGCTGPLGGFCPADYCWSVFVPTPPPACASQGQTCSSSPNACGMTGTGTIDASCNCTASTPSDTLCPLPSCANGSSGPYPGCPLPSCADFGQIGVYPDCYAPPPDPDPTCADLGLLGVYPDCYALPPPDPDPTCADSGQLGTYPDCYDPPGGGDPSPTATLTANPNPASSNTALTWTSTNATSCTGVGTSFSTGGATSGTDSTVTPGFTYQVQCSGPGGSVTAQVAVGLVGGGACPNTGPLTITATPNRVQPGGNVTLSWSAGNVAAASCTVTSLETGATVDSANANSCSVANQTTSVSNIQAQTTFRLTCGTLTKDTVVNMVPRYEEF